MNFQSDNLQADGQPDEDLHSTQGMHACWLPQNSS